MSQTPPLLLGVLLSEFKWICSECFWEGKRSRRQQTVGALGHEYFELRAVLSILARVATSCWDRQVRTASESRRAAGFWLLPAPKRMRGLRMLPASSPRRRDARHPNPYPPPQAAFLRSSISFSWCPSYTPPTAGARRQKMCHLLSAAAQAIRGCSSAARVRSARRWRLSAAVCGGSHAEIGHRCGLGRQELCERATAERLQAPARTHAEPL